jgi:hypothetical protein
MAVQKSHSRLKVEEVRRYIVKSSKTASLAAAVRWAEDLYDDLKSWKGRPPHDQRPSIHASAGWATSPRSRPKKPSDGAVRIETNFFVGSAHGNHPAGSHDQSPRAAPSSWHFSTPRVRTRGMERTPKVPTRLGAGAGLGSPSSRKS